MGLLEQTTSYWNNSCKISCDVEGAVLAVVSTLHINNHT